MTQEVFKKLQQNDILLYHVPSNAIQLYQSFGLTFHGLAKAFMERQHTTLYGLEITESLN